jgi:hypothetical protein
MSQPALTAALAYHHAPLMQSALLDFNKQDRVTNWEKGDDVFLLFALLRSNLKACSYISR